VYFPEMKGLFSPASAALLFPELESSSLKKINEIIAADIYLKLQDEKDESIRLKNLEKLRNYSADRLMLAEKIFIRYQDLI
jgi:hypothetical protein